MANPSGDKLKKIQQMINKIVKPRPLLEVDGKWGNNTSNAVKLLQSIAKIKTSGEIDAETAVVVARAIKTGKVEKEQPKMYLKIDRKLIGFTPKEYERMKKEIIRKLRFGPLAEMRNAAHSAESLWNFFNKQNNDQWFVSWCIETTRGTDLPPKSLITNALTAYKKMEGYVSGGNLAKFHAEHPKSEKICNEAIGRMDAYREDMIDGGGNWVTGLQFTKAASFTFVGIFAAPVAASTLGTGALASAVVGNAAVAVTQSAAGELGNWSAGTANWTLKGAVSNVLIDGGVGALIGVFAKGGSGGKHVFEAAVTKVSAKLATKEGFKALSGSTVAKLTSYLLTEGAKSTTSGAIKDAAKAAKGDPKMNGDKFIDNLSSNFLKGVAFGPLGKVISKFGAGKVSEKTKMNIWHQALKELQKKNKGVEIKLEDIDKKTQAMVEKLIATYAKKGMDLAVMEVVKKSKGPMDAKGLEKKLEAQLFSPSEQKIMAAMIAKQAGKAILKSAK